MAESTNAITCEAPPTAFCRAYDAIQIPPPGIFNSDSLIWYPCHKRGKYGGLREEAWIPASRFRDFEIGESTRPQFQCVFKVRKTIKERDCITRRFWCSYGPEDEREVSLQEWATLQKTVKDSGSKGRGLGSRPAGLTVRTGLSGRRGCRCHFSVKTLLSREGAMLISWSERRHVDGGGKVCHGLLDPQSIVGNATIAPRLSKECVGFVERLLRCRVQPMEILLEQQQHIAEAVREHNGGSVSLWTRDMHLTSRDIRNIATRLQKEGQLYHTDDAQAIKQWTERFPEHVMYYQAQNRVEDKPFVLVYSTPWMIEKMAEFGHQRAICMDATHGTNKYGFQLFTWMIYDYHQNGVPCAWALLERHRAEDLEQVQKIIKVQLEERHKNLLGQEGVFRPSCFICDDSLEEKASIRAVYPGCPIDLCIWHVRSAFNKNLTSKVHHPLHRALMNKDLGKIMYTDHEDPTVVSADFILKWRQLEPVFVQYYVDHWVPRLKEWVVKYRNHKRSNQNTSGAVERWHSTLKAHIRSARVTKARRKISWLIVLMTSTIERYYWCMSVLKTQGRIRNKLVHDQVVTVCSKAKDIPDSHVRSLEVDGVILKVVHSSSKVGVFYTVTGWGTNESQCTCQAAALGNLCKHQVKVLFMEGVSETTVVKLLGVKFGSTAGSAINCELQVNPTAADEEHEAEQCDSDFMAPDEPQFHFPFSGNITVPQEESEASIEDLEEEVRRFANKVDNNPSLIFHCLAGFREVVQKVLKMQAMAQTDTSLLEDLSKKVPHPLEIGAGGSESTDLQRKKSWHEIMMDSYSRKGRKNASQSPMDDTVPLERVVKERWCNMEAALDADAGEFLLSQEAGNTTAPTKRRRRNTQPPRPKIGSNKVRKTKKNVSADKENILDLNSVSQEAVEESERVILNPLSCMNFL